MILQSSEISVFKSSRAAVLLPLLSITTFSGRLFSLKALRKNASAADLSLRAHNRKSTVLPIVLCIDKPICRLI
ncbi:Uncharacterised protein [Wolbachia endosymbiont wPip_Mol of Culex molestus]|nr:Uncharacterised protein [Wolbachia endosymbiont wPip_Mol of Culex molestus]